jgi:hypothetical protein
VTLGLADTVGESAAEGEPLADTDSATLELGVHDGDSVTLVLGATDCDAKTLLLCCAEVLGVMLGDTEPLSGADGAGEPLSVCACVPLGEDDMVAEIEPAGAAVFNTAATRSATSGSHRALR